MQFKWGENAVEHFLCSVNIIRVDNMEFIVLADFNDMGLPFSDVSSSRDKEYIEPSGRSPRIQKYFTLARISLS